MIGTVAGVVLRLLFPFLLLAAAFMNRDQTDAAEDPKTLEDRRNF